MGNFYNIPSAKTSGDFMYRCGNECSGIDHAAALYEQVCVPNDRGYDFVGSVWNSAGSAFITPVSERVPV